jgi:predicted nucleic acid binding AN1-type Zn finger protein
MLFMSETNASNQNPEEYLPDSMSFVNGMLVAVDRGHGKEETIAIAASFENGSMCIHKLWRGKAAYKAAKAWAKKGLT